MNYFEYVTTHKFADVQWMGLRKVTERGVSRSFRDAKPESHDHSSNEGVMIEVLVDGQFSYFGTNDLSIAGLDEATRQAVKLAKSAAPFKVHHFTADQRPKVTGNYQSPGINSLPNAEQQCDMLIQICNGLKFCGSVVKTQAAFDMTEAESEFFSSNGSYVTQKFTHIVLQCEAVAQMGTVTQKRTMSGAWQRAFDLNLETLLEQAKLTGRQAVELLVAEDCPSETMTLVLPPNQMMIQIHESIGHPLELDRILGDERNYAGWSFVKPDDFGKLQYGSPLLNVTFDPTISGEFASYAFDDTGNPAIKKFLIKDGVLVAGLGGLESSVRSHIPGVANMRASSWNRAPIDRMANLNIEPGTHTFESMIAGIKRGIIMETTRSWSIDDYRNKFQFGCEYARMIEDGKITKLIKNPNYRGLTANFWKKLTKVGDASTFEVHGTPNCGKGEPNQVIRVGHASPTCVFEDVEVFGGAS